MTAAEREKFADALRDLETIVRDESGTVDRLERGESVHAEALYLLEEVAKGLHRLVVAHRRAGRPILSVLPGGRGVRGG